MCENEDKNRYDNITKCFLHKVFNITDRHTRTLYLVATDRISQR